MGVFHDRMERQLLIRGLAAKTRTDYLRAMRALVKHCRVTPERITLENIQAFQQHLVQVRKISFSSFNVYAAGIRFFFRYVIVRDWKIDAIPYQKPPPRKLPQILNRAEIQALFRATVDLRRRAILMTVYSCGLRVSEARNLRISDIDSQRMVIRIEKGKGGKDRYVMLSKTLLAVLREYFRKFRPKTWLFENEDSGRPLCVSTLEKVFHRARVACSISKPVTIHSLRHAFATHLLESGTNTRVIQMLLGHRSLRSTEIYTHVASEFLKKVRSPVEDVDGLLVTE